MTRRGFTLIEVMVALVITSLVALTAHEVFRAGVEAARSLRQARRALDAEANGRRLLAAAFLSADIAAAGQTSFDGTADRVRFATWLEMPDGWFEPVAMDIRLDGQQLIAQAGGSSLIVLLDSVAAVRFDYLMGLGADEAWISRWSSPLDLPIGVRLRVYRHGPDNRLVGDTSLFLVKERR